MAGELRGDLARTRSMLLLREGGRWLGGGRAAGGFELK